MSNAATAALIVAELAAAALLAWLVFTACAARLRNRMKTVLARATETEGRLHALTQGSGDAIVALDQRLRIVEWNLAADRLFGFARAEVIGRDGIELLVPSASRAFVRGMLERFTGGSRYTHLGDRVAITLVSASGQSIPVDMRLSHFKAAGGLVFAMHMRDLRGERDAAAALRSAERRHRAVLDGVRDIVFQTDRSGVLTFLNQQWRRATHFSLEETLGRSILEFVLPEDREQIEHLLRGETADLTSGAMVELRFRSATQDPRVMILAAQPLYDSDGAAIGLVGTIEDVTERRAVELRLRDQLRFNRDLLEAVPVPVSVRNLAGEYIAVNRAWERFAGADRKAVLGRTLRQIFPGVVSEDLDRTDREIIATGGTWTEQRLLRGMDGVHRRALYCRSAFVRADGSEGGVISAFLGTGEQVTPADRGNRAAADALDSDAGADAVTLAGQHSVDGLQALVDAPTLSASPLHPAPPLTPARRVAPTAPAHSSDRVPHDVKVASEVARGLQTTVE